MAGGLVALLDDVAVRARAASERELPIVRRIAVGSLRNKILVILPVALLLSQVADGLLTPVLVPGGDYLCYEGAHQLGERVAGHETHAAAPEQVDEDTVVRSAVRTDDGLRLAQGSSAGLARLDRGMPARLGVLAVVRTAAMLWVGGHILLAGTDDLGWHGPYALVHRLEEAAHDAAGGGAGWLAETLAGAVVGVAVGGLVVLLLALVARAPRHPLTRSTPVPAAPPRRNP